MSQLLFGGEPGYCMGYAAARDRAAVVVAAYNGWRGDRGSDAVGWGDRVRVSVVAGNVCEAPITPRAHVCMYQGWST